MQKSFKVVNSKIMLAVAFVGVALLSGCDNPHEKLASRLRETFDMGSAPIPGRPGYTLHGYRMINDTQRDHFVYVLEQNGQPVAGTGTNYDFKSGKSTYTESISSAVMPGSGVPVQIVDTQQSKTQQTVQDTCASVAECKAKIAALHTASKLEELQEEYQELQQDK